MSARERGTHEFKPLCRGLRGIAPDDFYNFAVAEFSFERDELAVDLCSLDVVPEIAMYSVREVDRCGLCRQVDNVALWSEDEHTV